MESMKIGIVGCGDISDIYLKNCTNWFDFLEVVAVLDLITEKAEDQARKYNIPTVYSTIDEMLDDEDIDIILNLTVPAAHAEVSLKALNAGKHVYTEKPLALNLEEGKKILHVAKEKDLLVGSAPDTFLGGGLQTCRKLIDDGWIGRPVAASGFLLGFGPEGWHPNPDFFYQAGGGPMFDMGPYYLTALVTLLGSVKRVSGSTNISYPERTITSEKRYGEKIRVEVPTHIAGVMEMENGVIATLNTSFDIAGGTSLPPMEIYGSEGTLIVPDPNTFGGPVRIKRHNMRDWQEIPLSHGFTENSRGLGLADMAIAIREGRKPRVNGELAYHVLELMHGFHFAAEEGKYYNLNSVCERPEPLPRVVDKKLFMK